MMLLGNDLATMQLKVGAHEKSHTSAQAHDVADSGAPRVGRHVGNRVLVNGVHWARSHSRLAASATIALTLLVLLACSCCGQSKPSPAVREGSHDKLVQMQAQNSANARMPMAAARSDGWYNFNDVAPPAM